MLEQVKKYGIIITIAILFALFSFSIVDLIDERPQHEDFCPIKPEHRLIVTEKEDCPSFTGPTEEEQDDCNKRRGRIEYAYDEPSGCPVSFECNTCYALYDDAAKQHRLIGFIITSIMGIIAILVGIYTKSKEEVVEWVYAGLLIGGMLSILFGTISYFHDMGRFVKPFVLLTEIVLVIWIAIKTVTKKK